MDETANIGPDACSLTEQEAATRCADLREALADRYLGADVEDDVVTLRFDGVAETLSAVASFVERERDCCSFATYRIVVEPPYEETRLAIDGPEGTADLFREELATVLAGR